MKKMSEITITRTPAELGELARVHRDLLGEGASPESLLPIVDFVASANDLQASQLRPYELADLWGQPRRDLLETRAQVLL